MGTSNLKNIEIDESRSSYFIPRVSFNAETGVCEISGESYLEDTNMFYQPLLEWLETYTKEEKKSVQFSIRLKYYNTSSSKYLLELLKILKEHQMEGGKVEVYWYYPEVDTSIMEDAEDYREFLELDITILPY